MDEEALAAVTEAAAGGSAALAAAAARARDAPGSCTVVLVEGMSDQAALETLAARLMTVKQCAAMFGVSRTTIMKFLAAERVALRRPGDDIDDQAVVTAYRDERLSLHDCAARFGISQRRVAAVLERHGVPCRPVGRPPRPAPRP